MLISETDIYLTIKCFSFLTTWAITQIIFINSFATEKIKVLIKEILDWKLKVTRKKIKMNQNTVKISRRDRGSTESK